MVALALQRKGLIPTSQDLNVNMQNQRTVPFSVNTTPKRFTPFSVYTTPQSYSAMNVGGRSIGTAAANPGGSYSALNQPNMNVGGFSMGANAPGGILQPTAPQNTFAAGMEEGAVNQYAKPAFPRPKTEENVPPNQLGENLLNFASSPQGAGLARGLLEASGYSTTPVSFGQAIAQGLGYMMEADKTEREQQREDEKFKELLIQNRIANDIEYRKLAQNMITDELILLDAMGIDPESELGRKYLLNAFENENTNEPVYRYMLRAEDGQTYNVFTSKGASYAEKDGQRIPQKDWQEVFGNHVYRTASDNANTILAPTKFGELQRNVKADENSLKSYVRYLDRIGDTDTGYKRLFNEYTAWFNTFFGRELTTEELQQQLASGELQRLIGASRVEIVGGGVMTEQDAFRIIEALGGNVDFLQDPKRVQGAISQIFREKYDNYLINLTDYNAQVQGEYKTQGYKTKSPIKFSDSELALLDPNVTTSLGITQFTDLSEEDFDAINAENLQGDALIEYYTEGVARGKFQDLEVLK
tara:strand:+ start:1506 stop:3092 length:1587 start_codon:yes stop_codon:yes gene_type:complete